MRRKAADVKLESEVRRSGRHLSKEKVVTRFSFLVAAGLALVPLTAPIAHAQDYPTRQITLIAPWPAGGAVDALCRAVAPHLSDRLRQSVRVGNPPRP